MHKTNVYCSFVKLMEGSFIKNSYLYILWSLSKQNPINTNFYVPNRQVFGLYRLN
jgi:hypothetical protein